MLGVGCWVLGVVLHIYNIVLMNVQEVHARRFFLS